MPNLMQEFLSDIVKSSDTAQTILPLRTDAKDIQNTLMGGIKTTQTKVMELKQSNGLRGVFDWFRGKNEFGMHSSFSSDDDADFDAGFEYNHEEESDTKVLDKESMNDIGAGQTHELFQIGEKQIESKLHMASEIINTMDVRSSELVSRLRNSSDIISKISNSLDRLLSVYSTETEKMKREQSRSIFDSSGKLSIHGLMDYFSSPRKSGRKDLINSVKQKTRLDELDKSLSKQIDVFQNKLATEILKLPIVQKALGGDKTKGTANKDYSAYIENQYTTEPAVFDKITRKTIVDIIPGYLKHITQGLTGVKYNVSSIGTLTTEEPIDKFDRSVEEAFHSINIKRHHIQRIAFSAQQKNASVSEYDISMAQQILLSQYIYDSYKNGRVVTTSRMFKNGGIRSINMHVAKLLASESDKGFRYWNQIISEITITLQMKASYRESFAKTINEGFQALDAAAKRAIIESGDNIRKTQFTQEMFDEHARKRLRHRETYSEFDGMTPNEMVRKGILKKEQLPEKFLNNMDKPIDGFSELYTSIQTSAYESTGKNLIETIDDKTQYIASIFNILNRGINAKFTQPDIIKIPEPITQTPTPQKPIDPTLGQTPTEEETDENSPEQQPTVGERLLSTAKNVVKKTTSSGPFSIIGKVKSVVQKEFNNIKSDISTVGSHIADSIGEKVDVARLEFDAERKSRGSTEEQEDAQSVKNVLAGMKSAVANGDGKEDISHLLTAAKGVKDPKTRDRLTKVVSGVVERSQKKDKPKSLLGKAVLLVYNSFKTAIDKAIQLAKNFLSKATDFFKKLLDPAFKNINSGLKHMKEGLFGKKGDSPGLIGRGVNLVNKTVGLTGNLTKLGVSSLQLAREKIYEKRLDRGETRTITQQVKDTVASAKEKISEKFDPIKGAVTTVAKNAKDAFTKTQFGQGFLSAFEEDEKQKETVPSKIVSTSLFDQGIQKIIDMIEGKSTSPFLDKFLETLNTFKEALSDFSLWLTSPDEAKKKRAERKKQKEEAKKKKEEQEEQKPTVAFDLGKVTGGLTKIFKGIAQSVGSIVKSLTGLTAIMNIGEEILKKSLAPLNKVFQNLVKMLKPVVQMVTKILKQLVEVIVEVVQSIIKLIQPILEALEPIINSLLETLKPILELVTGLVNVLMIPLMAIMKVVVVPVLRAISNTLEVLLGIVQVGMGIIMTALGGWLIATGTILKFLTLGFGGDTIKETGDQIFTMGTNMVKSGAKSVVSGIKKNVSLVSTTIKDVMGIQSDDKEEESSSKSNRKIDTTIHGSALDATYGSGDSEIEPYDLDVFKPKDIPNIPQMSDTTIVNEDFGSGDDDSVYQFNDEIKDAFSGLRGVTNKLLSIFTDKDDEDDISNGAFENLRKIGSRLVGLFTGEEDMDTEERLENASEESRSEQTNIDASSLTDDEKSEIETIAFEKFKKDYKKKNNESDADYQKRYEKSYKSQYVSDATRQYLADKAQQSADGTDDGPMSLIDGLIGDKDQITHFKNSMYSQADQVQGGQFGDMVQEWTASHNSSNSNSDSGVVVGDGHLVGSSDAEKIYNYLVTLGMSGIGAAGLMGCFHYESGMRSNNLEDSYNSRFGVSDEQYTANVDSGVETKDQFVHGRYATYLSGQTPGEAVGYGLPQFTSSNLKKDLYEKSVEKGKSIADISVQLEAVVNELKKRGLYSSISNAASPTEANKIFLWKYEAGTGYTSDASVLKSYPWMNHPVDGYSDHVQARHGRAEDYYKLYKDNPIYKTASSVRHANGTATQMGSKSDWIKTVAMVFEGYMNSGQRSYDGKHKYYDAENVHSNVKLRNGQVISLRPDCSGTLGAAMTAFGYKLDWPPSSSHYNVTGSNGNLDFIKDPDGSVSRDWQLLPFSSNALQPGDITGNTYHASFPVTDLTSPYPRGMDAGGDSNLVDSAKAATAYLDGKSNIPWRSAMGSGAFSNGAGAKNIVRYVGSGSYDDEENNAYIPLYDDADMTDDDYDLSYISQLVDVPSSSDDMTDLIYEDTSDIELPDELLIDYSPIMKSVYYTPDLMDDEYISTIPEIQSDVLSDEMLISMNQSMVTPDQPTETIPIPALPVENIATQDKPIIVNKYQESGQTLLLPQYVDAILLNEYDIESSRIKELVDEIFTELPEYLEDDDEDDEFSAEDDYVIQQLASVMM